MTGPNEGNRTFREIMERLLIPWIKLAPLQMGPKQTGKIDTFLRIFTCSGVELNLNECNHVNVSLFIKRPKQQQPERRPNWIRLFFTPKQIAMRREQPPESVLFDISESR